MTVFEAGERLLARAVPAEIAGMVADRHKTEGVTVRTGVGVAAATGTARGSGIPAMAARPGQSRA